MHICQNHRRRLSNKYGFYRRIYKFVAVICLSVVISPQPSLASDIEVTAFGDSLIHGFGLPPDDGFVPQLNRWLQDKNVQATIVNAGVSGETTQGGLARIAWTLETEPDAFILALGGNDVLRGLNPEQSRQHLTGILSQVSEANIPILLIGQIAPQNYGQDYQESFESIFPDLAAQYDTLFFKEFFAPLESTGSPRFVRETYFQDDGLHPNAAGVGLIVDAIGPMVLELIEKAGGHR